jgi:hypothetical protein
MAGDLSYFLAVDSPETIRLARPDDLARWKIGEAEAWRMAISHLKARIGPLTQTRLGSENGASGLAAASGLAPSMLADPAICGPSSPDGLGRQLVLVYARDMFLYSVPSDVAMTATFWSVAKTEVAAGRSMSATVLTCHAGHWTEVAPAA